MLSLQTPETHCSFLFTKKGQRGQSERLGNNSVSLKKTKKQTRFFQKLFIFCGTKSSDFIRYPTDSWELFCWCNKAIFGPKWTWHPQSYFVKTAEVKASTPPSYKNTIQRQPALGCECTFKTQTFDTIKEIVSTLIQISPRTFHCKQTANKVMLKTSEFPRFEQANV